MIVFLSKWLHLLSIAGIVGWTAYGWLGLSPTLKDEVGTETSKALWRRFGIGIGALWVVALLTGTYNAIAVSPSVNDRYHTLLGAKIALAIVMFLLTVAIAHPVPGFQALLRARYQLLAVVLGFGVCIVGLSAYLNLSRISGKGLETPRPSAESPTGPTQPARPNALAPTSGGTP